MSSRDDSEHRSLVVSRDNHELYQDFLELEENNEEQDEYNGDEDHEDSENIDEEDDDE